MVYPDSPKVGNFSNYATNAKKEISSFRKAVHQDELDSQESVRLNMVSPIEPKVTVAEKSKGEL